MKRFLSLTLALVMVLGAFTGVFAAEESAEDFAVDFLVKNEILKGAAEDGDLMLDKGLERREAVVLLSRLLGEEEEAEEFADSPSWEDAGVDPYYLPFLAWAEANEYFEGDDEGNFNPREEITGQEYILVIQRALGYEDAYGHDAWKAALEKGKKLGLLENVEVADKEVITRAQMAVMTFNALSAELADGSMTLAEFLGIEMPEEPKAKELTAKVNDTENLKEVVLELSNAELADADKLENVNNYKVVGNVVEKAEIDGDNVIVLLKNPLLEGRSYKLRVRSIDKAINKEYTFKAKDNTIPSVEEVVFSEKYGIKLRTSEPINLKDGDRGRSFEVDGKNIAMNVEVYGRDVILTPYHNETFSEDAETLTVSGLADFAGFRSAREEFEIEVVEDEEAPEVVDVILRGDKKVEVVFDKDIYIESVEDYYDKNNVGNISYQSGRHTVYAKKATKIDSNKVEYEFEEEFLRTRTDFTIVDVENHSGVKMEKTTMVAREIIDDIEPEIFDHQVRNVDVDAKTATIRLFFDKDVNGIADKDDSKLFDVKEHFTLYEREVFKRNESEDAKVSKAYYALDREDVIDVELTGLEAWTTTNELDYILEVENFTDQASRRNRMFRDYIEFKFQASTGFNIVTDGIKVDERKYETEITIEFNKPVDRVIAEDFKNYIFEHNNGAKRDVKDLKGTIVTERRGYEVSIILPDFKVEDYKNFRILDTLKNTSNQRLDKVYVYNFETGFAENADYTIAKDSNGNFEITKKANVDEITLKTDVKGTFIIKSNLDKLVIDAPNADVVIADGVKVDEVVVKAIKGETLTIAGTVDKVIVETEKVVSIKANDKNFILISDVKNAKVKVNGEAVAVEKDEEVDVTVDEDGKVETETETGKEEAEREEAAKLEEATTEVDKLVRMKDVTAAEKAEVQNLVDALADSAAKEELQGKLDEIKTVEDIEEAANEERLSKLTFKIKGIKTGNVQRKIEYTELDTVVSENAVEMLNALIVDDNLNLDEVAKAEILLALKEVRFDKSKIVINAEGEIEVEDGFLVTGWKVLKDERLGAKGDTYNVTLIDGQKEYRITISENGSATIATK